MKQFILIIMLLVCGIANAENNTWGTNSGVSLTTGNENVFAGDYSGYSDSSGTANTFIGQYSGFSNRTGKGNVAIGYMSAYPDSANNHKLQIRTGFYPTKGIFGDFSTGYFGINNSSPTSALSITGNLTVSGTVAIDSLSNASGIITVADSLRVTKDLIVDGRAYVDSISNPAGALVIPDSLTVTGVSTGAKPIVAVAADTTAIAVANAKGTVYYAIALAGKAKRTLPSAEAGLNIEFIITDADSLLITAATGDSIITTAGAAYSTTSSVAGSIKLICLDAVRWIMQYTTGTWTSY